MRRARRGGRAERPTERPSRLRGGRAPAAFRAPAAYGASGMPRGAAPGAPYEGPHSTRGCLTAFPGDSEKTPPGHGLRPTGGGAPPGKPVPKPAGCRERRVPFAFAQDPIQSHDGRVSGHGAAGGGEGRESECDGARDGVSRVGGVRPFVLAEGNRHA